MNKPKLGFVFFGQIRTDKCFKNQLKEIKLATKILSEIADFKFIDCTRTGIENNEFEREELKGYESPFDLEKKYDPLANYRNSGKRNISGGLKYGTIFLQAKDFNDLVKKRPDIDFIFRLRVDLLVNHQLICKAIKNVVFFAKLARFCHFNISKNQLKLLRNSKKNNVFSRKNVIFI